MRESVIKVEKLINKYGERIKDDKKLLLAYWKEYDGVNLNKETIYVNDFIYKATDPTEILNARNLLESMKGW